MRFLRRFTICCEFSELGFSLMKVKPQSLSPLKVKLSVRLNESSISALNVCNDWTKQQKDSAVPLGNQEFTPGKLTKDQKHRT